MAGVAGEDDHGAGLAEGGGGDDGVDGGIVETGGAEEFTGGACEGGSEGDVGHPVEDTVDVGVAGAAPEDLGEGNGC